MDGLMVATTRVQIPTRRRVRNGRHIEDTSSSSRVKPKLVTGRSVASRRIASRHIRALTERRKKKEEKRRMSVVGIDFGNANNVVALARRKGIDVVLNDESKRETPSMLNFGEKQVRRRQTERERERRRLKEG